MFVRLKLRPDGRTTDGRQPEEAWREQAQRCWEIAVTNPPDGPGLPDYSDFGVPDEAKAVFAGAASFNTYIHAVTMLNAFSRYWTPEQRERFNRRVGEVRKTYRHHMA